MEYHVSFQFTQTDLLLNIKDTNIIIFYKSRNNVVTIEPWFCPRCQIRWYQSETYPISVGIIFVIFRTQCFMIIMIVTFIRIRIIIIIIYLSSLLLFYTYPSLSSWSFSLLFLSPLIITVVIIIVIIIVIIVIIIIIIIINVIIAIILHISSCPIKERFKVIIGWWVVCKEWGGSQKPCAVNDANYRHYKSLGGGNISVWNNTQPVG